MTFFMSLNAYASKNFEWLHNPVCRAILMIFLYFHSHPCEQNLQEVISSSFILITLSPILEHFSLSRWEQLKAGPFFHIAKENECYVHRKSFTGKSLVMRRKGGSSHRPDRLTLNVRCQDVHM